MSAFKFRHTLALYAMLAGQMALGQAPYDFQDSLSDKAIYNRQTHTLVPFKSLGDCRIICKDKSTIRNVSVVAINEFYITYEKDGSLHDLLLDRIKKIKTGFHDKRCRRNDIIADFSVYFDKKMNPYLDIDR